MMVELSVGVLLVITVYMAVIMRHRAAQRQEIAQHMDALIQNLPGMLYRSRNENNWPMEFVSDGCNAISGYTRTDFESQQIRWGELVHTQDYSHRDQMLQKAINEGTTFAIEYRIIAADNEEHWVWEQGQIFYSNDHSQAYIEGFITDITERKRTQIALFEARAFSEAVVNTAAEAVITMNHQGMIEGFNKAAQQMFGYSLEHIQKKNFSILIATSGQNPDCQSIKSYIRQHNTDIAQSGQEVNACRQDGSVFPIYLSVSEVQYNAEQKIVGLIRDISLQRAAEREARQHRDQLAHADRLHILGEMATGIAHEINQPLTAISLFSQAGKRLFDHGDYERIPEIFEKLSQHAIRAGNVIERVQTMARRGDHISEICDCNQLIEEVCKLAEIETRTLGINIQTSLQKGLPPVSVDSVQIQQVALNLLRNGIDSMRSVSCRQGNIIQLKTLLTHNGDIEIQVIDCGSGVPDDAVKKLFNPFFTTKKTGMGMGLSICKSIITEHGGKLSFRNTKPEGSVFSFTLPTATAGESYG